MRNLFKEKNLVRICLAAFFMSSMIQLIWVVLPFIIKAMGGSDTQVGLCFMGHMGVYVLFCIIAGLVIDRLKPKKVLLISVASQIIVTCGIIAVAGLGGRTFLSLTPITQMIFLMSMIGVNTAFFWPVMMGWISTGHEGAELTKRFGFFNVTWGTANMLLPILGGYLMLISYFTTVAAAGIAIVLCLAAISITKPISENEKKSENIPAEIGIEVSENNEQFIWLARVALFSGFICIGIFRSQLAIYYKFELGFDESIYGWAVSLMCLFNVITFYLMGRSHRWHYRKSVFAAVQILIIVCMLMIILSPEILVQLSAAGLAGISFGVVYSSHQYYGVSGGTSRSRRMAIHETILGAGFATGSLLGGIISDHFGRNFPYWFGCGVIAAAGICQVILWLFIGFLQKRKRLS